MSTTISYPEANLTITYVFNDPRTLPSVIFHSLLLRSIAFTGMFYLTRIQRQSRSKQAASLLFFFLIPTYPLSLILCRLVYCLQKVYAQGSPDDRYGYLAYMISATLGLRTWTNASSIAKFAEDGGLVLDSPHEAYDNSNSSSLLAGNVSDFKRLECNCTTPVCKRYNWRTYFRTAAILALVFVYCTFSLHMYVRRSSRTYVEMVQYLLQGTPPGRRPADIYSNALETISTFDQANAIWAFAGLICALSALVLRIMQWEFEWKDSGNRSDEITASEQPSTLSHAEYALSFLLYVLLTRQTWYRVIHTWRAVDILESLPFTWGVLFFGIFTASKTYDWMTTKETAKKEAMGKLILCLWVVFVTLWPVVYSVKDAWELSSCVKGGGCPHPLFLWKDEWSHYLWIY